jgi:methionine-rich copper-binding protein CopC
MKETYWIAPRPVLAPKVRNRMSEDPLHFKESQCTATTYRKPLGTKRRLYMTSSIKGETMQEDLTEIEPEPQFHTQVYSANTTIVTIDAHKRDGSHRPS